MINTSKRGFAKTVRHHVVAPAVNVKVTRFETCKIAMSPSSRSNILNTIPKFRNIIQILRSQA
jgi:hypothetical protein